MDSKKQTIENAIKKVYQADKRCAELQRQIEELHTEINYIAREAECTEQWLAQEMDPDAFNEAFGYYPEHSD